jgi:hypothetical protein
MNVALAPFIVEGLLIIVAALFGFLLGRKGKPYGKGKLVVHLFFFAWLAVGMTFILQGALKQRTPATLLVLVMAICLVAQLLAGIGMLASRSVGKRLPMAHKIGASVMLLADVCALIITAVR